MTKAKFPITLLEVTNDNVADAGIYCVKDKKSPGYLAKLEWFKDKINKGLKITIATDGKGKQLGFIEYIPSEISWRPFRRAITCSYSVLLCSVKMQEKKEQGVC